jgi:hypothetical protein
VTRLSLPVRVQAKKPIIYNSKLPDAQIGEEYSYQLFAGGTTGPYRFDDPARKYEETTGPGTISLRGGTAAMNVPGETSAVKSLPFSFPFYGKEYDKIIILSDGGIIMGSDLVTYPYEIDSRVRFYYQNGVYPFLGELFYSGNEPSVTLESSESEVVIRWHAYTDPKGENPLVFAARIQPDGNIGFYYGDMEVSPDVLWISGVSAGNNRDYLLLSNNFSGIQPQTSFAIGKTDWPTWLQVDREGNLSGIPAVSGTYSLPFRVTDWTGIRGGKEMTLVVKGGSGISAAEVSGSIRVFPNPAGSNITLQGITVTPGALIVSILDLEGRVLINQVKEVPAGEFSIIIEEKNPLPAGTYLYQVDGVVTGTGRFIRL